MPSPPPSEPRFYRATPLQQILPPTKHPFIPKNRPIETKESSKTINFSYCNSFAFSLTVDTPISLKMIDIPLDDYSLRRYRQKVIKGYPHPRCIKQHYIVF
ncbi:hypothetical protein LR48_Vigan09g004900 [Vigna angularis]|uniref:Uncharacterized protein n=1 Tax=Phaseolus angularis TaxID=3914 RepID=A0A0L9V8H4_PHAAN|nr:hypothetical protein LR48_Vigan09g004900 [Vigna angularis]